MQRITNLWQSGRRGKIVIGIGSFLVLCCSCVGVSLMVPPTAEPTQDLAAMQTSAFETAAAKLIEITPTFTLTSAPSATSAPTFAEVSLADYPATAASRFQTLQGAMNELVPLHNQLTADITVAQNNDWYVRTTAVLTTITFGADELAAMTNFPPEYQVFHDEISMLSQDGDRLFDNYMLAMDNQNVNALNMATANLANMITRLNNANNAIAAASIPPTATQAPLPTATLIVYQPTAVPAAVCSCSGDLYNCSYDSFSSEYEAQACYNYCISVGAGDIHDLDRNHDGGACDSGLN